LTSSTPATFCVFVLRTRPPLAPAANGSQDSDIIIITAGARQHPGESRFDLIFRNARTFASIVPLLVALSSAALLLVVSNPMDILTAIAARLAT